MLDFGAFYDFIDYNNHTQDAHNYVIPTSSLSLIGTFSEKGSSCIFNITNKITGTSRLLVELSCSKKSQYKITESFAFKLIKNLEFIVTQAILVLSKGHNKRNKINHP